MSSARHSCNCDHCRSGREKREDLVSVEDFDEFPRYRTPKRRKRNVCAKSKAGEPCDHLGRKVKGTKRVYDHSAKEWRDNQPRIIECCSRCGREYWWTW